VSHCFKGLCSSLASILEDVNLSIFVNVLWARRFSPALDYSIYPHPKLYIHNTHSNVIKLLYYPCNKAIMLRFRIMKCKNKYDPKVLMLDTGNGVGL